jgi:hypothetical protein
MEFEVAMKAARKLVAVAGVGVTALAFGAVAGPSGAVAAPLIIANFSFEAPDLADGASRGGVLPVDQGAHGWHATAGAYIYNPLESDYAFANFDGTPRGADGSQVGTLYGPGDDSFAQRLAGPDAIVGSADDPLLFPGLIYTLTFSVGQRFAGNPLTNWGGYDIQLVAGLGAGSKIVGREADAATPQPGSFVTRTATADCMATLDPALFGQPFTIFLRKTSNSQIATTDFDHVRLEAEPISSRLDADFDELGAVNAADLARWREHFGALCLQATHDHGNADADADVDGHDFLVWQRQLGDAVPSPVVRVAPAATTLPEPSTAFLASAIATAALPSQRRRRLKA